MVWALKEWAIAVDALLAGELILLIRKGGIHERRPTFEIPSDRPLLFPTYEHQRPDLLRPAYGQQITPRPVPDVGEPVMLKGWSEITHRLLLPRSPVAALRPFHIWTDKWLEERLAWKPERPAYALLLRTHRFMTPVTLPYQKAYGGCRSWIAIEPDSLPESQPVLQTSTYEELSDKVQAALSADAL